MFLFQQVVSLFQQVGFLFQQTKFLYVSTLLNVQINRHKPTPSAVDTYASKRPARANRVDVGANARQQR